MRWLWKKRRYRLVFSFMCIAYLLAMIWPVHAVFSTVYPFVLGLPFSIFWLLVWNLLLAGALVVLYLGDHVVSSDRKRG